MLYRSYNAMTVDLLERCPGHWWIDPATNLKIVEILSDWIEADEGVPESIERRTSKIAYAGVLAELRGYFRPEIVFGCCSSHKKSSSS